MTDSGERRFRLTLHYDGLDFQGWQLQARGRTVQGELEAAVERITGERRRVVGAGRTDSGVHATGQVAAVTLSPRWEHTELHRALNAVLPPDVWVDSVQEVDPGFHPRFAAVGRSYRYQIGLQAQAASPFHSRWCWNPAGPMKLERLRQAAAVLVGQHSFKAFSKSGQEHRGHTCHVSRSRWVPWESLGVAYEIQANRFLHHMVRYLVGTMVDVGKGRRTLDDLRELLSSPDTELVTSPPAPPQGLFLTRVHYPEPDSGLD